ncbi:hypothetical protein QOZ88_06020 [Blastococcus sp. BMG 814]|uniref:Uncharacterized protein n=1 Tax=Blastococcus carthaginiensis TaxID=3050034 RepID=A0ABT9IAC3_9ACTN|nr:hypothetical protein [Blastococcus carthaginiensis]MDP5182187.1 hypothetical protein [Blastococcus carthaginiensis]
MPGLDALAVGGGVTDPRDARHAVGGLLALQGPSALDVRTGVLVGPGSTQLITGTSKTSPMSVQIGAHVAVTSRGAANGAYLGPTLEAPTEVNVELAPASGSRIDVVYVKQRDTTSGVPTPDATTGPLYGVLTGQVSTGTPVKPSLTDIVGAEELGTVQVSAGATSTNGSGVVITNTARQSVPRGAPVPVRSKAERDALQAYPGLEVVLIAADGSIPAGTKYVCTVAGSPGTWVRTSGPDVVGNGSITGGFTGISRWVQQGRVVTVTTAISRSAAGYTLLANTGTVVVSGLPPAMDNDVLHNHWVTGVVDFPPFATRIISSGRLEIFALRVDRGVADGAFFHSTVTYIAASQP